MNKISFSVIALALMITPLFGQTAESMKKEQLRAIEKEMEQISEEIHACRLQTMQDEVESMDYRNTNLWNNYVEEVESAENCTHKINKLQKRLNELQIKKEKILEGSIHLKE